MNHVMVVEHVGEFPNYKAYNRVGAYIFITQSVTCCRERLRNYMRLSSTTLEVVVVVVVFICAVQVVQVQT
jgi:hypothetical protein